MFWKFRGGKSPNCPPPGFAPELLYNIFKLLGCPETLISVLAVFQENMKARVQFDGSMSKTFPICRGVKQGCVQAPTLFGVSFQLFLHMLSRKRMESSSTLTAPVGCLTFPGCVLKPRPSVYWFVNCCTPMTQPWLLTPRCTCKTCANISLRPAVTSVWPSTWRKQS